MMLVAIVAVWYWRRRSRHRSMVLDRGGLSGRWPCSSRSSFRFGANANVIGLLQGHLPHAWFLVAGGLFIGIQSSACEIGLTLLAGLRWKQLGQSTGRAIAVGVGAGAFEAFLLGLASVAWHRGLARGSSRYRSHGGRAPEGRGRHTSVLVGGPGRAHHGHHLPCLRPAASSCWEYGRGKSA